MAAEPDDLLGERYRLIRKLGSGGMASVFLAEDSVLGREVALKRLHADSAGDAVRRFQREAQLTAGLSHENLVAVFDAFSEDEDLVVVMEYVAGTDLSKAVATHEVTEDALRLRVLADVAAALDHVHAAGIVHRDVKPSNVLLAEGSSRAKLTDLGIAKVLEDTGTTQTNIVPGSLAYMAPEQLANEAVSPATDVYALALIAHELFSGERGRSGGWAQISHEAMNEPPPDVREARPGFPAGAARAIQAGLAREPGDRPRSATALVEAIGEELRRGETEGRTASVPVTSPATPVERRTAPRPAPAAPRRSAKSRWRWIPAVGVLALLCVLGVLLLGGGDDGGGSEGERVAAGKTTGGEEAGGGAAAAPTDPTPAEAAVADFYGAAADGDFAAAVELASPALESQLGGEEGIASTFSTLESISFETLEASGESGSSAEVDFATTAVHTDRTESCTGSAAVVSSGGTWLVDRIEGVSCDVTG